MAVLARHCYLLALTTLGNAAGCEFELYYRNDGFTKQRRDARGNGRRGR
jgi:hypothetical protein